MRSSWLRRYSSRSRSRSARSRPSPGAAARICSGAAIWPTPCSSARTGSARRRVHEVLDRPCPQQGAPGGEQLVDRPAGRVDDQVGALQREHAGELGHVDLRADQHPDRPGRVHDLRRLAPRRSRPARRPGPCRRRDRPARYAGMWRTAPVIDQAAAHVASRRRRARSVPPTTCTPSERAASWSGPSES